MSFAQLPDDIVEKIMDDFDVDTLKNFCLTSKKYASFLNYERNGFKVTKDKIKESLWELELTGRFSSLDEIDNIQQIDSRHVDYAMSPIGYSHTILCLNHMKKIRRQYIKGLDFRAGIETEVYKKICKATFFFLFWVLGMLCFFMFLVCFGAANDMYYKYPEGKIVTKTPIIKEGKSSEEFEALFNGDEIKDEVWRKRSFSEENEEEEEEEEEEYLIKSENIFFLWHFTSAAVCLALLSIFWILGGLFSDMPKKILLLLLLLLLPLLLPAVRMDEFTNITYFVFFIPAITGMAALLLFIVVLQIKLRQGNVFFQNFVNTGMFSIRSDQQCCVCYVGVPLAYLFVLAGFILFVMRICNTVPSMSLSYSVITVFPLAGALLLLLLWSRSDKAEHDRGCATATALALFYIFLLLCAYGALILLFCLRKDGVFTASYHYVLLPWYIGGGAVIGLIMFPLLFCITGDKCQNARWDRRARGNDLQSRLRGNLYNALCATLLGTKRLDDATVDSLASYLA